MKILAVEFSSERRSVAIVERQASASRLCGFAEEQGGRNVAAFAMIERALREAGVEREEIDCIAIGLGPGSYTGIRAAIALAQGWQLARETRILGISSVECLAAQAQAMGSRGRVNFIIDAQRTEFYLAAYQITESGFTEVEPLRIVPFTEVEKRLSEDQIVLGPDATQSFSTATNLFADAATLGRIALGKAEFVPGETLEPIYLRETSFVKAPPPRIILDCAGARLF